MKYGVYCIRDNKFQFYAPQCWPNDQMAVRDFDMQVHRDQTITGFKPSDFDLYKVGTFESDAGVIEAVNPAEFIVNGGALL